MTAAEAPEGPGPESPDVLDVPVPASSEVFVSDILADVLAAEVVVVVVMLSVISEVSNGPVVVASFELVFELGAVVGVTTMLGRELAVIECEVGCEL